MGDCRAVSGAELTLVPNAVATLRFNRNRFPAFSDPLAFGKVGDVPKTATAPRMGPIQAGGDCGSSMATSPLKAGRF